MKDFLHRYIPPGCPFAPSTDLVNVAIAEKHQTYGSIGVQNDLNDAADTFFLTWDQSGDCFTLFMDGTVVGSYADPAVGRGNAAVRYADGVKGRSFSEARMGFARFVGGDPTRLTLDRITAVRNSFGESTFRYSSAILSHNGIVYVGSSNRTTNVLLDSFVGFNISSDGGATFAPCGTSSLLGDRFPAVKLGEPHVVDFGRNMEHSPDEKIYLVGHGSMEPNPQQHWMYADDIFLSRVSADPSRVNEPGQYEFFAGQSPGGTPRWSKDFSQIRPLVSWKGHTGQVAITYLPALRKFIMTVSTTGTPGDNCDFHTYFLEADSIDGDWRIITYWQAFGSRAYQCNIPSKFIDAQTRSGALGAWLLYSANYNGGEANPPGSRYAACFRQIVIWTRDS